jgi:hypothetical protein
MVIKTVNSSKSPLDLGGYVTKGKSPGKSKLAILFGARRVRSIGMVRVKASLWFIVHSHMGM